MRPAAPPDDPPPGSRLRRLAARGEIDRALVYAFGARAWTMLVAPVTLVLIARYFSADEQGFYFTFASLIALQSFVELGFYNVIIHVASHDWAALGLDERGRVAGDPEALSRLVSLGRLLFKWYAVAASAFAVVGGWVGFQFFSREQTSIDWQGPWIALVVLSALVLWALPFVSLLEGCNQVDTVNRFRLSQAVVGALALWVAVVLGAGLWAAAVSVAVNLARDVFLLGIRYRRFFGPFFHRPTGDRLSWRRDIWPMQWRIGVSGTVNYLANSVMNPVMFAYHGPAAAGRMGMTMAVVNGLRALGAALMQTKSARFGMLVARRQFDALDRMFFRASAAAISIVAAGAVVVGAGVLALQTADHSLADRLLGPGPTALLLAAAVIGQVSQSQSTYLRSHKQEPIVVMSVTTSVAIGLLVWLFGRSHGEAGVAAAYLGVWIVAVVWGNAIWRRCRLEWHGAV